jgi:hypothetical protein
METNIMDFKNGKWCSDIAYSIELSCFVTIKDS